MTTLFGGVYDGARVLVTGHTGFKGSWLALWLQQLGAEVSGLALAPDSTPAHWDLLGLDGVDDLRIDLRDAAGVRAAIARVQPQMIFHLAAQPLVRRSYREPVDTFAVNITGLVHLFEAVRECPAVAAVVNVTTDKVYLDRPVAQGYPEAHPLGGHDPYSTSKACSELLSQCYQQSYFSAGPRLATARAGNVIGGGDWSEDRLVPDLVRSAVGGTPLVVRNPEAIRPWQHVLEPLSGYLRLGQELLESGAAIGAWNFGPPVAANLSVRELVASLCARWPGIVVASEPARQPHETAILTLDSSKARTELDWRPVWDAPTTIARTVDWYRAWHSDGELRSREDLAAYIDAARLAGIAWAAA